MDYFGLFCRAVKSGCVCSIFYHGFLLISGTSVTVKSAAVFTIVFILLYFLWLVLVSLGAGRKNK